MSLKYFYVEIIATAAYPLDGCNTDDILSTISDDLAPLGLTVNECFTETVDAEDPRVKE